MMRLNILIFKPNSPGDVATQSDITFYPIHPKCYTVTLMLSEVDRLLVENILYQIRYQFTQDREDKRIKNMTRSGSVSISCHVCGTRR